VEIVFVDINLAVLLYVSYKIVVKFYLSIVISVSQSFAMCAISITETLQLKTNNLYIMFSLNTSIFSIYWTSVI